MGVLVTVRTRFRGGTSCSSRERLPRLRYARTHRGGTGARLSTSLLAEGTSNGKGPAWRSRSVSQTASGVLSLTDEKGRRFLVQTAKIAYVEISAADVRRVGFGIGAVGAEAVKNA